MFRQWRGLVRDATRPPKQSISMEAMHAAGAERSTWLWIHDQRAWTSAARVREPRMVRSGVCTATPAAAARSRTASRVAGRSSRGTKMMDVIRPAFSSLESTMEQEIECSKSADSMQSPVGIEHQPGMPDKFAYRCPFVSHREDC